jgi:iron-regulated transporter 1
MSAILRAIDLTTAILAPVATGQIMYFIALRYGAVFIAGWNIVSVFVEYILIWKVYEKVPALKKSRKGKFSLVERVTRDCPMPTVRDT